MENILGQVLNSIGELKSIYTLVDFYEYIKGVEYLICVAFFIVFTKFFKYINKPVEVQEKEH